MTVKRLQSFERFLQEARSEASPEVKPLIPPPTSNVQQDTRIFQFQSYFDNTLLERAILPQLGGNPIIDKEDRSTPGYAIGLHPASDTPVAIEFRVGGSVPNSGPVILAPGQVIRPYGQPRGGDGTPFSGYSWGLPTGWLGGGMATLLVFPSPDATVAWNSSPEIIFHRARFQVKSVAGAPAAAPKNWPLHFPWTNAISGALSIRQGGLPNLTVTPTRTLMSLRLNSLATATQVQFLIQASNDFDLDSAGNPILTNVRRVPYTWGTYAATGIAGNLGTAYPVDDMPDEIERLAADAGGISIIDATAGGLLVDQYIDIVRYGRVG